LFPGHFTDGLFPWRFRKAIVAPAASPFNSGVQENFQPACEIRSLGPVA
jgi:hypothetical protein